MAVGLASRAPETLPGSSWMDRRLECHCRILCCTTCSLLTFLPGLPAFPQIHQRFKPVVFSRDPLHVAGAVCPAGAKRRHVIHMPSGAGAARATGGGQWFSARKAWTWARSREILASTAVGATVALMATMQRIELKITPLSLLIGL